MNAILRSIFALSLALPFTTGAALVQAEPLSLVTGQHLIWNRGADPAISPVWNQAVLNDTDTDGLQLNSFTLRVFVRPVAAIGTLLIDQASINYPASNGVITANQNPILPVDNLPAFIAFSGQDVLGDGYDVADLQNLARLQFTTPDNATSGLWELVAVNDDTTDGTGWLDSVNGLPRAFTNSPFADGELVLGTIQIVGNGVPEPASILISGMGLAGLMVYALRRRTRAHLTDTQPNGAQG